MAIVEIFLFKIWRIMDHFFHPKKSFVFCRNHIFRAIIRLKLLKFKKKKKKKKTLCSAPLLLFIEGWFRAVSIVGLWIRRLLFRLTLPRQARRETHTPDRARARAHTHTHRRALRRTCVSVSSSLAGFFQVARRSSIACASLTKSAIWEPFFRFLGCWSGKLVCIFVKFLSSVVLGSEVASAAAAAAAAMTHGCLLQWGIWSQVDWSCDFLA
jgi:hypothetical protein